MGRGNEEMLWITHQRALTSNGEVKPKKESFLQVEMAQGSYFFSYLFPPIGINSSCSLRVQGDLIYRLTSLSNCCGVGHIFDFSFPQMCNRH